MAFDLELGVPSGWVNIPIDQLQASEVGEWIGRVGRLSRAGIPPAIESIFRITLKRMIQDEMVFASYYLDVFEGNDGGDPYMVLALVTGMVSDLEGSLHDLDELQAEIESMFASRLHDVRRFRTGAGVESLSTATRRTEKVTLDDNEELEHTYADFRAYIPDVERDRIVSLICITPNLDIETDLRELFEAMAGTVSLVDVPEPA